MSGHVARMCERREFCLRNLRERAYLGDSVVDVRIML